jgi:hypothetical protein
MCDDMAVDVEGDISCTDCNAQERVTKRTVHVVFRFPFAIAPIGK